MIKTAKEMNFTKKSPLHRFGKPRSPDTTVPTKMSSNPFDSDDESDNKQTSRKPSPEPALNAQHSNSNPFDDEEGSFVPKYLLTYAQKNRYKNDFRDVGGVENQSVEELENYAVYKSEETTKSVNNCLKIASDIREDASKTLVNLHHQGEQITRTHMQAADIDHDLSRGEKLLGSLGGLFSKTWKPKINRPISGPVITRDGPVTRTANHIEQREKLGLARQTNGQAKSRTPPPEATNALQKVEVEKGKQDDSLSELSDLLGELKDMALDMGSEIQRQTKALDHFDDDAAELGYRVKEANRRTARLLGK